MPKVHTPTIRDLTADESHAFLGRGNVGRIAFTLRKIDKLTRLFHKFAAAVPTKANDADSPPEFSEEERQILDSLPEWYLEPRESLNS